MNKKVLKDIICSVGIGILCVGEMMFLVANWIKIKLIKPNIKEEILDELFLKIYKKYME